MKKFTLLLVLLLAVVGVKATEIWTGNCVIGNWSGSSVTVENTAFESAKAGDIIRITFSGYTTSYTENDEIKNVTDWSYALQQKDNNWNTLTDFTGGNLKQGQKCASYVLTENDVTTLKANGLAVNGQYITISKVELLSTTSESLSTTSTECGSGWANLELTWNKKGSLANAQKFDCVRVTYTVNAKGAQMKIQTVLGGWIDRAYKWDDTYDEGGTNTDKTHFFTISDAAILEQVQQAGIAISAANVTITAVDLIKPNDRYDAVPLTIGSDGIATFGSSKHLDFTGTGVTPYYATELTTGTVTLTAQTCTRAWSGCIVQGEEGDYEIPVATSEVTWQDCMNNLISTGEGGAWVYRSVYSDYSGGGDRETKIKTYYRYIFAKNSSGEIGFYKLAEDYTEGGNPYHTLAAHKAYLETTSDITPKTGEGARVALIFDDEATTSIQAVEKKQVVNDNVYYTLSGQRVQNPTRGLYIVNGKKVIIK